MAKFEMNADIEAVIRANVESAIAEGLKKDPKELINVIVKEALTQKTTNYSNETVFGKAVKNMITEVAKEQFKEWLEEHKELIKVALSKRLKQEKQAFIDTVANNIVKGLGDSFYVDCHMKIQTSDD